MENLRTDLWTEYTALLSLTYPSQSSESMGFFYSISCLWYLVSAVLISRHKCILPDRHLSDCRALTYIQNTEFMCDGLGFSLKLTREELLWFQMVRMRWSGVTTLANKFEEKNIFVPSYTNANQPDFATNAKMLRTATFISRTAKFFERTD